MIPRARLPVLATILTVACAGCGGGSPGASGPDGGAGGGRQSDSGGAGWTFLVYMVADNSLEPAALENLAQMAAASSTVGLNIVVELDRGFTYADDALPGVPSTTTVKRLLVRPDQLQVVQDLGEQDMGDPATLADFVGWGMRQYPAAHHALVLWDHAGALLGFGDDESKTGKPISIPALQQAVARGVADGGGGKLSLVGFDACLMATYEVAHAFSASADLLVASEELEPGAGWDYRALAASGTAVDPKALARQITDGYAAQNKGVQTLTMSVVDLAALADLDAALAGLQRVDVRERNATTIGRERHRTLEFGRAADPSQAINQVDLGDLLDRLAAADGGAYGSIRDRGRAALASAVAYQVTGPAMGSASGLSIYFPPTADVYAQTLYRSVAGVDAWRSFLEAYLAAAQAQPAPAFATQGLAVTTTSSGIEASAPLAPGSDAVVASAGFLFGYYFSSSDELDVYGDQPAAFDAAQVSATWNRKLLQLSQASSADFGYLSLQDLGNGLGLAQIPLGYNASGATTCSAKTLPVRWEIVFELSTGAVKQDVYYVSVGGALAELTPKRGSRFQPLVLVLSGTKQLTQAATQQGFSCTGTSLAADEPIAVSFVTVTAPSGVQLFTALTVANAAGTTDLAFDLR